MSNFMKQAARQQLIAGLRAVADFYQQQPTAYYDGLPITLNMYVWGTGAQQVLDHTSSLFGVCSLVTDQKNVTISHKFNDQVTLSFFAARVAPETRSTGKHDRNLKACPPAERAT